MVAGQVEQGTPTNKNLQVFQPYMGTWVGELAALDDEPGSIQKGDRLAISLTFSWAKNRHAVIGDLSVTLKSGVVTFGQGMYVWDPQRKTIVGLDTTTDGGVLRSEISGKDGKLIFAFHGCKADGTSVSSIITYEAVKDDSFSVQATQRTEGDRALPDSPHIVLRRSAK
jgi:hypothetical protein